jgi:hypothetical protein
MPQKPVELRGGSSGVSDSGDRSCEVDADEIEAGFRVVVSTVDLRAWRRGGAVEVGRHDRKRQVGLLCSGESKEGRHKALGLGKRSPLLHSHTTWTGLMG